jgi:glycerate kinase
LAKVLTAVSKLNPRRCLIGVGGSATNDGGFGLARALGWRFLDRRGNEIHSWPDLVSCHQIIPATPRLGLGQLIVAVDVRNPLLGPTGCTRVYGPQKGLRPTDFKRAEQALARMAGVMQRQLGKSTGRTDGAGAAGGLGCGLMTFLKAKPMAGFALFAHEAGLTRRIRSADLVITGEGRLDHQSLMGKGIGELLARCERCGVPCVAISGIESLPRSARSRFARVDSLASLSSAEETMRRPRFHLETAARQAAAAWTNLRSRQRPQVHDPQHPRHSGDPQPTRHPAPPSLLAGRGRPRQSHRL